MPLGGSPDGTAPVAAARDNALLAEQGVEALKRYASLGRTLAYGDLNRELGLPFTPGTLEFRSGMGKLCDAVNELHETTSGHRFMISALVHRADTGLPGEGFFKLADRLRMLPLIAGEEVRRVFVGWQCEAAFEAYREA